MSEEKKKKGGFFKRAFGLKSKEEKLAEAAAKKAQEQAQIDAQMAERMAAINAAALKAARAEDEKKLSDAEKERLEAEERKQAEAQAIKDTEAAKRLAQEKREREEAAKREAERLEQERITAEKREAERLEAERLEKERLEAERKQKEREEAERQKREKLERKRLEAERLAKEEEAAKKAKEEHEAKLAAIAASEKAEAEKKAQQDQLEAERIAKEEADKARLEQERLQREREEAARLKAETDARAEQERLERERAEAERADAQKREAEKIEQVRITAQKREAEKLAAEQTAARTPQPTPKPPAPASEKPVIEKEGFFSRITKGLKKSTSKMSDNISAVFTKRKLDAEALEELEDILIAADFGVGPAMRTTELLAKDRFDKQVTDMEIKIALADVIGETLKPLEKPLALQGAKPEIMLFVGVNGSGKTTTLGKIAKRYTDEGKKVLLCAGDTFRAAAVEQLKVWGERSNAPVVSGNLGADAAGLVYDAIARAKAENFDILMIDTAGRLQNRTELMDELAKVVRVIQKQDEAAPHHSILVLDATVGQNALSQTEAFLKTANVSGLIMTKLDGTAKGGVLVALSDKFKLPIHAIGIGERIEDLEHFSADVFAAALSGVADAVIEADAKGG